LEEGQWLAGVRCQQCVCVCIFNSPLWSEAVNCHTHIRNVSPVHMLVLPVLSWFKPKFGSCTGVGAAAAALEEISSGAGAPSTDNQGGGCTCCASVLSDCGLLLTHGSVVGPSIGACQCQSIKESMSPNDRSLSACACRLAAPLLPSCVWACATGIGQSLRQATDYRRKCC
jgi:hypothetical protein